MLRQLATIALTACLAVSTALAGDSDLTVELPAGPSPQWRTLTIDLAPYTGEQATETVVYDLRLATRSLRVEDVRHLPDWAIGVRLALGEVGHKRLLENRWGVLEAIGMLETIDNRMDPEVWNPQGVPGLRHWPGCGPRGSFATCASPHQYMGLRQPTALRPLAVSPTRDMALRAIDKAVEAWWVHDSGILDDITEGATSFVHRCGGELYGRSTRRCTRGAAPGTSPHTGPVAFKGPARFDKKKGFYRLQITRMVDYHPVSGQVDARPALFMDYLWGSLSEAWASHAFLTDEDELDALWADDSGI